MTTRHKWEKETYWTDVCTKCGCVRTRKTGAFPSYEVDGKISEFAPACSNSLLPAPPAELQLYIPLF